jgi:hypothetical protein
VKVPRPLVIALILAPAIFAAWMVARYSVNMPFWDEWVFAAFIAKAKFGGLTFHDFWEQYNESRKIFPRIVMIILARITDFDVRAWMWFSLCLVGATLIGIARLAKTTTVEVSRHSPSLAAPRGSGEPSRTAGRSLPLFIASLLLFSPTQYQNFLWGIQIVVFIPATCLIWGLVAAQSQLAPWKKWTITGTLAFIATYSYSNGLLCWPLLLPVLWKTSPKNRRAIFSAIWIAIAALSVVIYRFGIPGLLDAYVKPNWTPSLDVAIHHPLDAIKFFLAFLGQPLAETFEPLRFNLFTHISDYCATLGFLFLASFTVLSLLTIRKSSRALPWICFGAYTLLSGILTTVGRLGMPSSVDFAVTPRYRTFGLYLLIATIYLAANVVPRQPTRRITLSCAFAAALCVLFLIAAPSGVRRAESFHTRELQGKAALEFIDLFESPSIATKVADQYFPLRPLADLLDRAGYLHPPLIHTQTMEEISPADSQISGQIESFHRDGAHLQIAGWAILPARRDPADAVILAYSTPQGSIPFALIDNFLSRPEVAKALSDNRYNNSGFASPVDLAGIHGLRSDSEISAWSFDALTGKAHRLAGSVKLAENP